MFQNVSVVESIHDTINFPTPQRVKQPQIMTEPPPCLTVGTVHFGLNSSRGVLQTIGAEKVEFSLLEPNNTLDSFSEHFLGKRKPFSSINLVQVRATRPNSLASCARFRIVSICKDIRSSFSISIFTTDADFRRSSLTLR